MLDLHCHLLFDVDDGAPDIASSVQMASFLAQAGFTRVAPSPHFGEGPGGHVPAPLAAERRMALQEQLRHEKIDLQLLPNAEHHITPALFSALQAGEGVPIGGESRWLLVELPWYAISDVEDVMFRLQLPGYKLLLAHPERYGYLSVAQIEGLVERGVKMQLELGSFIGVYGSRAEDKATELIEQGWAHVLATDLHRPRQAEQWLNAALAAVRSRFGVDAVKQATSVNPGLLADDAASDAVEPLTI